eukprot:CAMPEP_0197850258 /NCGR_PEP_ID=MMETSP1438-20131217/14788_1 /TAXON_ID=1461541 /ORGANISM="Pterosperma sp., Strain CCMP1384" /LENGTH=75 /DNA_ID=CAMNT_0043463321 /DNA_START=100 /DNA_END=324 /DNA_ORIENTATION=-
MFQRGMGGMGGYPGMGYNRGRRNQQGMNPMVWFVLMRMYQQYDQMEHKPPGTLALIAVNVAVFFRDFLGSFAGMG